MFAEEVAHSRFGEVAFQTLYVYLLLPIHVVLAVPEAKVADKRNLEADEWI